MMATADEIRQLVRQTNALRCSRGQTCRCSGLSALVACLLSLAAHVPLRKRGSHASPTGTCLAATVSAKVV